MINTLRKANLLHGVRDHQPEAPTNSQQGEAFLLQQAVKETTPNTQQEAEGGPKQEAGDGPQQEAGGGSQQDRNQEPTTPYHPASHPDRFK